MEHNSHRPTNDQRAEQRRAQIVDAARQCVVRRGFHASTIADIAATAKMSVGLIYRYFANKEEIALAIVESVVNRRNTTPIPEDPEELSAGLTLLILSDPPPDQREDQLLLLEVHVEATRNPVIAEVIARTDIAIRERFLANGYKDFPALDPDDAAARMEMLAAIVSGTSMRRLARPGPPSDGLVHVYREMISHLLQAKPLSTTAQAPCARTGLPAAPPHSAKDSSAPAPARRRRP
jgi:AcrR family transcriptional regulator